MALILTVFKDEMDKFSSSQEGIFVDFPVDETDAAIKHAAAFSTYMRGLVTIPPVPSPIHDAAQTVMETGLLGQALPAPGAVPIINSAYLAYVNALIVSLTTEGYVVDTPPVPPGPIITPIPPGFGMAAYAALVDAWVRAITGSIPPATPVPWA